MMNINDIRSQLRADFATGKIYWTVAKKGVKPGDEAFRKTHCHGYKMGRVNGKDMLAHRVIWALAHGEWAEHHIDHINGDKTDNRLCNLRKATSAQNTLNGLGWAGKRASKYRGVTLHTQTGRWMARFSSEYLGIFDNEEDAARAWNAEAQKRGGEFARLNAV